MTPARPDHPLWSARIAPCGCRGVPDDQHVPGCPLNTATTAPRCENCGFRAATEGGRCGICGVLREIESDGVELSDDNPPIPYDDHTRWADLAFTPFADDPETVGPPAGLERLDSITDGIEFTDADCRTYRKEADGPTQGTVTVATLDRMEFAYFVGSGLVKVSPLTT